MALIIIEEVYLVTLILLTILQIAAVVPSQCTQFYTIFEEESCSASNSIQVKPALINPTTWNTSRYEMDSDECYDLMKEECFLELSCEDNETVCEDVSVPTTETFTTDRTYIYETTTEQYTEDWTFTTEHVDNVTELTEIIDTVMIEEREFFTLFIERTCDGVNSTVITTSPINDYTWNISRYDLYGDSDCYHSYPAIDSFLQLTCKTTTTCAETSLADKLKSDKLDPAVQYSLITIGCVASAILLSYIGYCAYEKVKDVLQSGVYQLPQ